MEEEIATTPVFLPGQFNGQRSLEGYSLGGLKKSDTTEHTHAHTHTHTHTQFPVSDMIYTYVGVLENKDYTNYSKGLTILVQLILEDLAKWATYNSAAN